MEKILYIGAFELPDKNAAAHRVLANAKALSDLDYDVVLLGLTRDGQVNESEDNEGFKCYQLSYPNSFMKWVKYILSNSRELAIIKAENPDRIIFYNYPAFKLYSLLPRFRKSGVKVYADVTEWYEASGFSISSIIKRLDTCLRMSFLHFRMDGLILISRYLEDFYNRKGAKNTIMIPPLVDVRDDKWKYPNKGLPKEEVNLVYAGSPGTGNKDRLDKVVIALKKVIQENKFAVRLRIVGLTQSQFVDNFDFHDIVTHPTDYSFLRFEGRLAHSEVLEIIKMSDYSIFFRDNNLTTLAGFPTKFVESISAGTPVITNFSSNLEEYYQKYSHIGYGIHSFNPEIMGDVFKEVLLKSEEERTKQKEFCRSIGIFDYRRYLDKFHRLFAN